MWIEFSDTRTYTQVKQKFNGRKHGKYSVYTADLISLGFAEQAKIIHLTSDYCRWTRDATWLRIDTTMSQVYLLEEKSPFT